MTFLFIQSRSRQEKSRPDVPYHQLRRGVVYDPRLGVVVRNASANDSARYKCEFVLGNTTKLSLTNVFVARKFLPFYGSIPGQKKKEKCQEWPMMTEWIKVNYMIFNCASLSFHIFFGLPAKKTDTPCKSSPPLSSEQPILHSIFFLEG